MNLYGTGDESRDFIYIKDLVEAINMVILGSGFKNDRINVANGKEMKISEVVSAFYQILDPEVQITFGGEGRPGDPINWGASIAKLEKLGYKNSISLHTGLKNYILWLKEVE